MWRSVYIRHVGEVLLLMIVLMKKISIKYLYQNANIYIVDVREKQCL